MLSKVSFPDLSPQGLSLLVRSKGKGLGGCRLPRSEGSKRPEAPLVSKPGEVQAVTFSEWDMPVVHQAQRPRHGGYRSGKVSIVPS